MPAFPRVTVITPSYNQAAFLEETIRSVLSQNYPNLEYFVMDGGSTDGSVEIIQRYAGQLAGWVSEKDRGQADAINKGFDRATGDIVAWLNSDDLYLPGAIASAAAALESHPQWGMVFGDVVSINGAGERINVMTYGGWGLDELMQFNIIGQPGVFMRREALQKAGPLDLSYHFLLDHHLWLRVAQEAPMGYIPQRWASARFHADAKNVARAADFGAGSLPHRPLDGHAARIGRPVPALAPPNRCRRVPHGWALFAGRRQAGASPARLPAQPVGLPTGRTARMAQDFVCAGQPFILMWMGCAAGIFAASSRKQRGR